MLQLKYIIHNIAGYPEPVIFGPGYQHDMMARLIGVKDNVVSAGFLQITTKGVRCYGESLSLGVSSRPIEDSELINAQGGDNI
jgi:hypothetical protein